MPTIQQQVAEEFVARLGKSAQFDAAVIEQLGTMLKGRKVKAEDLIKVFTTPPDTELK